MSGGSNRQTQAPVGSQVNEVIPWQGVCVFLDVLPTGNWESSGPRVGLGWRWGARGTSQEHEGATEARALKIFLLSMKFFQFQFYVIR